MEPIQLINSVAETARNAVMARLARFSNSNEAAGIRQSFYFSADRFCGIRFESGPLHANWFCDQSSIEIKRGNIVIDQIPLHPENRRAA